MTWAAHALWRASRGPYAPAVAGDDEARAGDEAVRRADDAVDGALARAVALSNMFFVSASFTAMTGT